MNLIVFMFQYSLYEQKITTVDSGRRSDQIKTSTKPKKQIMDLIEKVHCYDYMYLQYNVIKLFAGVYKVTMLILICLKI